MLATDVGEVSGLRPSLSKNLVDAMNDLEDTHSTSKNLSILQLHHKLHLQVQIHLIILLSSKVPVSKFSKMETTY